MNLRFPRILRITIGLMTTLLIVLAVLVTSLRVLLPNLNRFQGDIEQWVNQRTHIHFTMKNVHGSWRNIHPSIVLQGVTAKFEENSQVHFSAGHIAIEFDLLKSILEQKPVIADMTLDQLNLDTSSIAWQQNGPHSQPQPKGAQQSEVLDRIDGLFLRQLDNFSLRNSTVLYQTASGKKRQLDIQKLRWKNKGNQHYAEGVVSIADVNINSLSVAARFEDYGSLRDVSGQFYADGQDIQVGPWLSQYAKAKTGISSGVVSLNAWVTLKHSQPESGYLRFQPSELTWKDTQQHHLYIESGIVNLLPTEKGWKVSGHSLKVRTDETLWPELDIGMDWTPQSWRLNLSQLDIKAITPLARLFSDSSSTQQWIQQLQPQGRLEDIRVAQGQTSDSLRYSAQLVNGAMSQWELLPEVHHLQAKITGSLTQAHIQASLVDDTLPYGDVFQAPLHIAKGKVDLVWQQQAKGWSLWSDQVHVTTADLDALGQFRLDMPDGESPFLSFYSEVDLQDAGQTWRYLPRLALGDELTNYLSTAIQAGRVNTAKLVWYGRLSDFPYQQHNGIFQAWVGLKDARFSFDTAWPPLTDLQLNLLFENDAMYLDSHAATLQNVHAQRITGEIPSLSPDGHISIDAKASGQGDDVKNYMTSSPLVDSVGAALTAVQVKGNVSSHFRLTIPFSSDQEARAWGWADIKDSTVAIKAPQMELNHVSGRINFDNDVIKAAGLSAELLDQPISLDFNGESTARGYNVHIDTVGDWEVKPLGQYIGQQWTAPLSGHAPWQMGVNLQLNDVGFNYQVDVQAGLNTIASDYPYPLNKALQRPGNAHLQASGDQQQVNARLSLPHAKYQTLIDISHPTPRLVATNAILGQGQFALEPIVGHRASINIDKLNLDKWIGFLNDTMAYKKASNGKGQATANMTIPMPEQVNLKVKTFTAADIDWHDVNAQVVKKTDDWTMTLNSQEAQGHATYLPSNQLQVVLDRLHLYVPALDEYKQDKPIIVEDNPKQTPLVTDIDRSLFKLLPSLKVNVHDFWFQGYKVGDLDMDMVREKHLLSWKNIDINSGTNDVHASLDWFLNGDTTTTTLNLSMKGENNSDLMDRFGITAGIQKAPFELHSDLEWRGAPWSMRVSSLKGKVKSKFGKGVITDVSGAANLLGIFSLDSLIRRMKLDFSDVFDKGMAFNSITGTGKISQGIFVTNDIDMDAVAGELSLKGMANLSKRTVDAQARFVPDMTSGIPVLSAFAVTPQTALYVLAITTVISPVVEVFTEVNYEIKGPLDHPKVKEISRSKGEYKLPESLQKLEHKLEGKESL